MIVLTTFNSKGCSPEEDGVLYAMDAKCGSAFPGDSRVKGQTWRGNQGKSTVDNHGFEF